jgi:hypothetical protein
VYGPETIRSLNGPPLNSALEGNAPATEVLRVMGWLFDLPSHPYLLGLDEVGRSSAAGRNSYLLGRNSTSGWWYYFPVVFLVKTPTAVLLLAAVCLVVGSIGLFRYLTHWRERIPLRKTPFRWIAVVLPLALYTVTLLTSRINLGVRHMLPIYPFLFVLLAAVVFHTRWAWFGRLRMPLFVVVAALQLFETVHIYPHYLAFFNTVSGGPGNGPRYLADSNIDWGQDSKKLKKYLDSTGWKGEVCLSYFGTAPPSYYGVHTVYLPETEDVERRRNVDCLAAISVTQLCEVYAKPGEYQWLREREPIAKVGYSIYVYDLRKRPASWPHH